MTTSISRETFDHLVELAALELDEVEAEYLLTQLNNQLKAIHELESIPLDGEIAITSHGVPFTPQISAPIREDARLPYPDPQVILAQAPETEEGFIVTPEIPHVDLD